MARFLVPHNGNFPEIDSVIELDDGRRIAISSKAGGGSNASIWEGLAPYIMRDIGNARESRLKRLLVDAKVLGINAGTINRRGFGNRPGNSLRAIHDWGIRRLLGIRREQLRDTSTVYKQIVSGRIGKATRDVLAAIHRKFPQTRQSRNFVLDERKRIYPHGITGLFCSELAKWLNRDKASIQLAKDTLAIKGFYQITMDNRQWIDGIVKFTAKSTQDDIAVKFAGNKGGYSNIRPKSGQVNYWLR